VAAVVVVVLAVAVAAVAVPTSAAAAAAAAVAVHTSVAVAVARASAVAARISVAVALISPPTQLHISVVARRRITAVAPAAAGTWRPIPLASLHTRPMSAPMSAERLSMPQAMV
jgi:hypothetical protein